MSNLNLKRQGFQPFSTLAILAISAFVMFCGGDTLVNVVEVSEPFPNKTVSTITNAPGSGAGGPAVYQFWAKDRRASASHPLNSFQKISAERLAVSQHFVLYRESTQSALMNSAQAQAVLDQLEIYLADLLDIYGLGVFPDVQKTGRIVILAQDIRDDYTTTNAFVSGYFAPRDLYNDEFTVSLVNRTDAVAAFGVQTVAELHGRSNMLPIVYADLNPLFNGAAYNNNTVLAGKLFAEMLVHEIAHLLTYYTRVIDKGLTNHAIFIAEGLAEVSPMQVNAGSESQKRRMHDFSDSVIQSYLRNPVSLASFGTLNGSQQEPRVGYVLSNLFFQYVRHRAAANSASVLRKLVAVSDSGISGLKTVIEQEFSTDFAAFYNDFIFAFFLSAGGKNLTQFTDAANVPAADINNLKSKWNYSNAELISFGSANLNNFPQFVAALGEAPLPNGYSAASCLPAYSAQFYRYYTATEKIITLSNSGTDSRLKIFVATIPSTSGANTALREYAAGSTITLLANTFSGGVFTSEYRFILVNPGIDECLNTGNLPHNFEEGSITSWLGGGENSYQSKPGAITGNQGAFFMRPGAIATNLVHSARTKSYLYIADYMNQRIMRYGLSDGQFEGFLGDSNTPSTNAGCVQDSSLLDTFLTSPRTYSNHCRRSFSSPRGIAVLKNGDLIIADSDNHRLVRRSADGEFLAWLGDANSDLWQCLPGATHSFCGGTGDVQPPFTMGSAATRTSQFYFPWGIAVDEDVNPPLIYVVNYGNSRVVRRNLNTGAYLGFSGNGVEGWNQTHTSYSGTRGTTRTYFDYPRGIAKDKNFLYIADAGNHRIVRIRLNGTFHDLSGTDNIWLGGDTSGWHAGSTPSGSTSHRLYGPADVAYAELEGQEGGTDYLYGSLMITENSSHRIRNFTVRRTLKSNTNITSEIFEDGGWLGAGFVKWQSATIGYDFSSVNAATFFPAEFIFSPNDLLIVPKAVSGLTQDFLFQTSTYSGRISRWNLNCLWNQTQSARYAIHCGEGQP